MSSMRTSSARTRCATAGQSVRSRWCSATSRLVRIDANGLRSSCDASDTNWRCFRADASSRSSMAFIVRARRPTSSSVSGSGTRRLMVAPVIDSASWRIDSTGLSARPVKYQAAERDEGDHRRHRDQQHVGHRVDGAVHLAVDCWATRVMLPAVVWISRSGLLASYPARSARVAVTTGPSACESPARDVATPWRLERRRDRLRLQVVELLLVRLVDAVEQVVVHQPHEPERGRADGDREGEGGDDREPDAHRLRPPAPRRVVVTHRGGAGSPRRARS